jgi:glutamate N-acetyltransferase / amino-acid N-acetyltransferase
MISPSMATMLCFITTDANIPRDSLRKAVLECVEDSFNRITIDGDMSTNDTVLVLANGASGMPPIRRNGKRCRQFRSACAG